MKKYYPHIALVLICLVTANFWIFAKEPTALRNTSFLNIVSQLAALIGFVLMSVSFLMATRARFLERAFGGLDRLYTSHKTVGSLAFILSILHPITLFVDALPEISIAKQYVLPSNSMAYTLGVFAAYAMVFSFIFIVFVKLPYNIWKWSHRLLGISFFLGGIHALTIGSDIGGFLPLKIWVYAFLIIGLVAFWYIVLLYKKYGPRHDFEVKRVDRILDVFNLYLAVERNFKFEPGQFVYLAFVANGIPKELHPFSLASSPAESLVRISAKVVGDYTLKLTHIKVGDKGVLYGPYGSFADKYNLNKVRKFVWIAGGIGVTPFLAMLRDEFTKKSDKQVCFYYCCKDREEAIFHEEIEKIAGCLPNVNYTLWCSNEKNRISALAIATDVSDLASSNIQVCGPKPMMEALTDQFTSIGIPQENIRYEEFELVS